MLQDIRRNSHHFSVVNTVTEWSACGRGDSDDPCSSPSSAPNELVSGRADIAQNNKIKNSDYGNSNFFPFN